MRLGTTSYIYPADIITNARKLAGRIDDMELLLFELDEARNNLPDHEVISELKKLAAENGMSYTVHLPLDLRLADDDNSESLAKALSVIECTRELSPHGFVVHVEGATGSSMGDPGRGIDNFINALEILGSEAGGIERLCVENLEDRAPESLDLILEMIPVSCCVDVGHLWKQEVDPIPLLERWAPRTRVVHLHGVTGRDHRALSVMPVRALDPVVGLLHREFQGVVTLEVFSEESWLESVKAFQGAMERIETVQAH